MIKFENVTKRYGNRKILDNLNLEISDGEFVSIIGNSGAGKSTIVKLITGEERPTFGHIIIDGIDLASLKGNNLQIYRQHIGVIPQDCQLLADKTVFENVAFALEARHYPPHKIHELTNEALKVTKTEHIKDNYPHQISGGESQLTALARAIVYKPNILLADEPTGHLDHENAKRVIQALLKINMHGTTVILTTHNKPLVELAKQRVVEIPNCAGAPP